MCQMFFTQWWWRFFFKTILLPPVAVKNAQNSVFFSVEKLEKKKRFLPLVGISQRKTGEHVEDLVSVTVKPRRKTKNSLFRVKCCESEEKSLLLWQAVINAKNLGSFTMKSNEDMPGIWSLLLLKKL